MSASDQWNYENSSNAFADTSREKFLYRSEQWIQVPDSNFKNYGSSQVVFDLSPIANSGRFFDAQRSYLLIPLVMSVSGDIVNDPQNSFALSLKNGTHNLINSLSIQLNNDEVVSVQNFNNLNQNIKFLSNMTPTDISNQGDTLGFYPDSAMSASYYIANTSNEGIGSCNNRISTNGANGRARLSTPQVVTGTAVTGAAAGDIEDLVNGTTLIPAAGYVGLSVSDFQPGSNPRLSTINRGRLERMQSTCFNLTGVQNQLVGVNLNAQGFTPAFLDRVYKNNVQVGATGAGLPYVVYHQFIQIRLDSLHDFFANLPLVKNSYLKMTLNMNINATSTINYTSLTGVPFINTIQVNSPWGQVPYQVSPLSPNAATDLVTGLKVNTAGAAAGTVTVQIGIVDTPFTAANGLGISSISQTQIIASLVDLNPVYEQEYLSNKIKPVFYKDYMSYDIIKNQISQSSIQQMLTANLSRLRTLIIYPFISTGANNDPTTNQMIRPINSPFCSEPATASPYCSYLTNFNVQISGVNIYQQSAMQQYFPYLFETRAQTANGGMEMLLSSGLVNQTEFDSIYGIYQVDLSRHDLADDAISKSVTVSFTNSSPFTSDYICILVYQKEFNLDCEAGLIVL